MDKSRIEQLAEQGITQREIASMVGLSQTGVRYWLKKYNISTKNTKEQKRWTDEQLTSSVANNFFLSDVLKDLGYTVRPGNYDTVKKAIRRLNLDTSHFIGKKGSRGGNKKIPNIELFRENCNHARSIVKRRIIHDNLIPYECSICGLSAWYNKPLILVLDHINGINNDNRLENLRFLCPNCNSQQDTFCRKK